MNTLNLEEVESPPTPSDLILASQGATVLAPGERGICDRVIPARNSLIVEGGITFGGILAKLPNALLLRSNNLQGPFERVVSRPIALQSRGSFAIQIDRTTDPGLFPGFFRFGIRNPKGNSQSISVVITWRTGK